jgi:hypothetical protein
LGERELCKLEVVGSIPIGSTNLRGEAEKAALRSLGEGGPVWDAAASAGRPFISNDGKSNSFDGEQSPSQD